MKLGTHKIDNLNVILTLVAIVLEAVSLVERFGHFIGDYLDDWIFQIAGIAPLLPLVFMSWKINFKREATGQLRYSQFWRDAASFLLGAAIVTGITVASPREVISSQLPILVADVDDYTRNHVFSGIKTRNLLGLALRQSPRLSVFPEQQVLETLDRMKKSTDQRINVDVGREICVREGVGPLIIWRADEVADEFTLHAQMVNPADGKILTEVSAGPFRQDYVTESIGELGRKIQKSFGDSVLQIRLSAKPLAPATTRSLPALRAFSEALEDLNEFDYEQAQPKLLKAVQLDPDFALAIVELASLSNYKGETQEAIGYLKKAFELRDRLTEPERVRVIQSYYWHVENDHEKALNELNEFSKRYPRNQETFRIIGFANFSLMKFELAAEMDRKALGGRPWGKLSSERAVNLWHSQMAADQLGTAHETAKQIALELPQLTDTSYMAVVSNLALGEIPLAESEISQLNSRENREAAIWLGGFMNLYRGRPQATLSQWAEYISLVDAKDGWGNSWTVTKDRVHLSSARVALLTGNTEQARRHLAQVQNVGEESWAEVGKYYARLGEISKSQQVLDQLRARLADRMSRQHITLLRLVESEIELKKGNCEGSFSLLSQAPEYPWADLYWPAQETRAYVALACGHPEEALRVATKMLRQKGFAFAVERPDDWILAHYYLGAAYEANNSRELALTAYKNFASLWPESGQLPIVTRAKKSILKLQH